MANYVVVALRAAGDVRQIERTFKGAPPDSRLAQAFRGGTNRYDLAVRYFPSRKGWMIIDMRNAFYKYTRSDLPYWTGTKRSKRVYPSESAAVVKAIYMLNAPEQIEFSL